MLNPLAKIPPHERHRDPAPECVIPTGTNGVDPPSPAVRVKAEPGAGPRLAVCPPGPSPSSTPRACSPGIDTRPSSSTLDCPRSSNNIKKFCVCLPFPPPYDPVNAAQLDELRGKHRQSTSHPLHSPEPRAGCADRLPSWRRHWKASRYANLFSAPF
jgi:hypothetical protein